MNLSLLLPWEDVSYRTKLSPSEIESKLQALLKNERGLKFNSSFSQQPLTYSGDVNDSSFSLKRNISYRNSFLPRIKGTISTDDYGTTVSIKMRLHPFVLVFLFIWISFISFFIIMELSNEFSWDSSSLGNLMPIGMLLFAYVLTTAGFKFESFKSKRHFQELLDAAEV